MKKLILALMLAASTASIVTAQTPTWEKYLVSDANMQVTGFHNDGSRIVIKDSLFTSPVMTIAKVVRKLSSTGAIQWSILFKGKDIISGIKVNQILTDASGNNYLLGSVKGTVYYLTDSIKSTFNSASNIYVAKISATGTIDWQWKSSHDDINFAGDDEAIRGVLKGDKLYIGGNAKGRSLSIGTFSFPRTANNTMYKIFVASLNTSGVVQWASISKDASLYLKSLDLDGSDNVYIGVSSAGNGTIDFGNSVTMTVYDNFHFAVKYNSSGVAQMAKAAVVGRSSSVLKSLSVDASGNMYFTGFNDSWLSTINGVTVRPTVSYIVKLDNTGAFAWLRTLTASLETNGIQYGKFVNNKLYIIANPTPTTTYIQTNATDSLLKSNKGVIVGAYTTDGTLEWNDQGKDGIVSSSAGIIEASNDKNNLYIGGTFIQAEKFGAVVLPTPGTNGVYHTGYINLKIGSGGSTGSAEVETQALTLYPNPATDNLFVQLSTNPAQSVAVKIMNLQGAVVWSGNVSGNEIIPVNQLAPAIYVLQAEVEGKLMTQKLIKQ